MKQLYKGKAKRIFVQAVPMLLLASTLYSAIFNINILHFHKLLTFENNLRIKNNANVNYEIINIIDTPPHKKPIVKKVKPDTSIIAKNDTFQFKTSKDSLDAPVTYHADDSMVMDMPIKKIYFYGKQNLIKYQDNELSAPHIEFDLKTNIVSAYLTRDSVGDVIAFPAFNQGDFRSVSDSLKFDMKSQKGISKSTYTQQGELFVHGEKIKKVNPTTFYALKANFTTCNLDTPHFAFMSKKIKFVNKKMAYTGPVHPEFEGVPIPIYLPFGIFPLTQGRHSGILAPTFNVNETYGISLEGMGYYKILNDHWDAIIKGTIYSYGGWALNISPRYYKRYHYRGSIGLSLLQKRDLDNAGDKTFSFNWQHSADTKSRPGVTFMSNVTISSNKYNQQLPNNSIRNITNSISSTISYTKSWKNKPFNLSLNAGHTQNTVNRQTTVNLPELSFSVATQYPFRGKEAVVENKWYENIGIGLNTNAKSSSIIYDSIGPFFKQYFNKFQWGASHSIPISLALPPIGKFIISPSVSYSENWYQKQMKRSWNSGKKNVDTTYKSGFFTARDMGFSLSASTRIFGMYTFAKNSAVKALRHEIQPQLGLSYKPDMNKKNWYTTQIDTTGHRQSFNLYENSVYGGFGQGRFGGLTFGLNNIIQMKIRNRKDTTAGATKKITLFDVFRIDGSYNFLKDSMKFSNFNFQASTNLFNKINVTISGLLDPYETDNRGYDMNKTVWQGKHPISLGRLINANIALQTQFKGGDKNEKLPNRNGNNSLVKRLNQSTGLPMDDIEQETNYINNNPNEFANFNIPWSISISYSFGLIKQQKPNYSGFNSVLSQSMVLNGTLNLTPKWQINMNGYVDIVNKKITQLSMGIDREMHCWQMSISIVPVGYYRSFSINISPKSSILRDLKVNRTRSFIDL